MPELHHYLLSYDISDTRRRFALVKLLKQYGVRVQKSVFEFKLTDKEAETLKNEALALCSEQDNDRLCFISLCQNCESKRLLIQPMDTPERKGYFLI